MKPYTFHSRTTPVHSVARSKINPRFLSLVSPQMIRKYKWNRFNLIGKRLSFTTNRRFFLVALTRRFARSPFPLETLYVHTAFSSATWIYIDYTWFIGLICILSQRFLRLFPYPLPCVVLSLEYIVVVVVGFFFLLLFFSLFSSSAVDDSQAPFEANMNKSLWYAWLCAICAVGAGAQSVGVWIWWDRLT